MVLPEIGFDLSKLSEADLKKISEIRGLPEHVRYNAAMLDMLITDGLVPVDDSDQSKEWTIPVSPRTKQRLERIIGQEK